MYYIYDIILNLTDSNRIYDFYEWELNDNIVHIKKMPVIKVDSKTMDKILNYKIEINKEFLNKIKKLTEIYENRKITFIEYSCIFTDSYKSIAIEFNEHGISILKSKLILDEEEDAINIGNKIKENELNIKILEYKKYNPYLTRKEEKIKSFLEREINISYKNSNYNKLKYIYMEYFDSIKEDAKNMKEELIETLKQDINEKHIKICKLINMSYSKK